MTDPVDRATRSRIMRAIRSKNTKPERSLRAAFAQAGLRGWRMWARDLPGAPDFAFGRGRVAVFVDSPFWHGLGPVPTDPSGYWASKFARSRESFARSRAALRERGWLVIEVLEDDARHFPGIVARSLAAALKSRRSMHRLSTASTGQE